MLDALGIRTLDAFVGCSYGAMVGLHFAAAHGGRLRQLVAISGSDRAHPYASAWRALQRRAVALGALQCDEAAGLALARELAMLSYRTPEEFAERFATPAHIANGRVRCGAEDYLDACGLKFAETLSAAAFLRLSESIDLHEVDAVVDPRADDGGRGGRGPPGAGRGRLPPGRNVCAAAAVCGYCARASATTRS